MKLTTPLLTLSLISALVFQAMAEPHWPRFRGPQGTGHSADTNLPVEWDADSVVWKTELKGQGQSSVVNWGNQMFVTSSNESGNERYLICLDKTDGKVLWEKSVPVANPEATHKMNSWATPTCATDGERVVAFFGPGGLHCYDMEGNAMWSRELGNFAGAWGIAASPIIIGNAVIQNCDTQEPTPSYLIAVHKDSGETMWKAERGVKPRGGWSTPILIETAGGPQLVLNGEEGVQAYDPANGKELWFCQGFNGRGSPVPDFAHGQLYVVNGKPGDTYVVKPDGKGDVTKTQMVWNARRHGGRDLPSPVVVGDYVLISSMSGILTCYDAKTGEDYYTERLDVPISASPLEANGLVYFQGENGEVVVVKPGKELEIVARNSVGASAEEIFRSTLSPIDGQIFARSDNMVYCISKK